MTTTKTVRKTNRAMTFDDLKGLRAEGYVRDSTLDQRDGFGPEMQRRSVENFARTNSLHMGNSWYTDFITGTSTLKRAGFLQALSDAEIDRFDVLLVYHTSRFARNRADAIRYKAELRKLGKTLVFVSQGIISGNDNDFLNEGINEVLDEQYSRNLSRFVTDGLRVKHEQGIANGVPPLGYKSEKLDNGKRERKAPDFNGLCGNPKVGGMETLLALLRSYVSGQYSYCTLADYLNAQGYRNREGEPFTKGSIEHVLSNRFYEGKAIYHPGEPDEEVKEGAHDVPGEVKSLWLQCQALKQQRTKHYEGRPRSAQRAYPFSKVTVCDQCGNHYGGQPVHRSNGQVIRRLYHKRPFCELEPHSIRVEHLMSQFQEGVLPYVTLDQEWKEAVMRALCQGKDVPSDHQEQAKLERALTNLRKQHLWGDISDDDYKQEKQELERHFRAIAPATTPIYCPNFDRAEQLLANLTALWNHPGTTDNQRESFIKEVFHQIHLRGSRLVAIEPKPDYQPLFACIMAEGVRKCRGEWI
ncbi:MAG: Recombinase protein [Dehalococcoidales bacterium]|nr:Recombinase protein [Dehalococcoidales bacterium]